MRSTVLLLSAWALALAGSTGAGAEIQWAGNPVIHLDANDLAVGEATTWTNKAAPGGDFVTVDELPVTPVVTESTPGQSGVARKCVMFTRAEPYGYGDNPSAMLWENGAPVAITDGAGFSVEGWVYITNDLEYQTFFSIGRRAAVPAETVNNFAFSASGGTGVRAIGMDTANLAWVEPRKGIPCYNYYAATYDSVSYTVSVYLNGELNASMTLLDPGLSIATDQPVYLGAMWFNANDKFLQQGLHQGGIAAIRVHDDVLTEAQILNNFDAEKADYITFAPVFDETVPVAVTVRAGGTRTMAPPPLLSPLVLSPPSTDITWSLAGAVPAGVTIDAAMGIITIAGTVAPGSYGFSVGAANSYGADSVAVTLTVAAVPEITVAGTLLVDVDVTVAGVSPGTLTTPLDNYGSLGGAFTPYNNPQIIALQTAAGSKNVLAQSGAINLVLQDGGADVPAPEDMTGNSGWTVEGWLQVETFAGDCQWFAWAPTAHGQHAAALLYATAGGYPAAWFSDAIGFWMFNWGTLNPNPVATDREWHYAVYTWDGTTFKTYMDGAPSVTETNPNGGLAIAPEQKIMLGRCYGDDGNPAYGAPNTRIAKVRVHSEALDAAGVLANYEAEKADFGPPPAPKIEIAKPVTPIVFGAQDPGAGPTAKAAVTIKNTGLVALPAGFQVAVSGANAADFVLDAPVTTALDAGESRSFAVAFDPSDSDPKTAAVTVSWPAGAVWSAGSISVDMYGNNKVVYIDQQNGSDDMGLGTFESPWQSIAKALASTLQGDMIMLEPGVYPCEAGDAWGGRIRQLKSTEGAAETTIEGGDHWWIGWTTGPTGLSFEGITFAPRLAGSGTCWLRNGTLSAFSLKLVDCVFTGNWGWDYTLHLGVGGAMLGELIAERTSWSTPDDIAVLGDGQTAGCTVTIKDCSFDGCRHALSLLGRNAVVAITGSTIERTTNHGITIYQGTDLEAAISNCTVREAGGAGITIEAGEVSTIALDGSTVTGCTMAGVFFRPYIDGTDNVPSMTITGCAFADNCRSTNDTFAAQGDITCNGWDNVNNVPAGAILIDRCWVGSIAHRALLPLNQGIVLIDADVAIVRNSVVEGGYRGIAIATADNRTKRIENCTLIGTDEASADDINPDTTAAVSHKDSTGYGEGLNAPVVVNCIVLGYDALDTGTEWDAASSNNIAFIEGDPALVDPKLAFQAGAPFARPGEISPLDARNDYRPAAGSPAIGAGLALAEVTVDFDGVPRPVPPSIGAFEGGGGGALVYVLMGNVNTDNKVDIADAIALLGYLFGGGTKPAPQCAKAADANDDDKLDIADAIKILGYLFSQQPMFAPDHGAITAANNTCTGYPADGNDGAPFFPANVSGLPACAVQCQ